MANPTRTETPEGEVVGANLTNTILAISAVAANLIAFGGLLLNWWKTSANERNQAAANAAHRMAEHDAHIDNNAIEWAAHAHAHHADQPHHSETGTTDGAGS